MQSEPAMDIYQEYLNDDHFGGDDNFSGIAKQVSRYFLIKLGSSSIGYPFELARLLRQIQYSPKDKLASDYDTLSHDYPNEKTIIDKEMDEILPKMKNLADILNESSTKDDELETDDNGYLKSPLGHSQWPIDLDKSQGLGSTALTVARRQGLLSTWQGLMPFWLHRVLFDFSTATIEEGLEGNRYVSDTIDRNLVSDRIDIRPGVIPVMAEAISGIVLSPIELIHTRMAVQSVYNIERNYSSSFACAKDLFLKKGILGLYPNLGLTACLKILSPSVRIFPSTALSSFWEGLAKELSLLHHLAYFGSSFAVMCAPFFIVSPLETIRRRLFVQASAQSTLVPRVPVAERKYTGFWNCLYRIIKEEGVSALYQGMSYQMTTNVLLLALNILTEFNNDIPEDIDDF
jgi:hypothetical protein